jgi:hypothetical protein
VKARKYRIYNRALPVELGALHKRWLNVLGMAAVPNAKDTAADWRKLAMEARAVASELTDPDAKRIMLSNAEGYERLARRAEARNKDSN